MKLLILTCAFSLGYSAWVNRSNRSLYTSIVIQNVEQQANDGIIQPSIAAAVKAYVEQEGVTNHQGQIPDSWETWFKTQTGEIECEGDEGGCSAGFLDLTPLWGYGCWCFFGNIDSTLGRGPPIDSYDGICKSLTQCYRCIIHDAETIGDECDPYNQEFESSLTVSGSFGISNITATCVTNNESDCAWRVCTCAMTMVSGFFNLSFDNLVDYDENLKHANGFDYALECPQQGRAVDRQCCGFYPSRRTYDRGDARDCCHERTIFNPLRHQCCDDGSHVGLGGRC